MKKIISQTVILTMAFWTLSCGSNTEKSNQEAEKNSPELELSINDFKGIPEEIEGCTCYFSKTDKDFKNAKYIFAASFDSIGFISVGKKLIKLKLISTGRKQDTFGDHDHVDVYNSELYKVTVDIKYKKSNGNETWWNNGTVTIENKGGEKTTEKFVGECGC